VYLISGSFPKFPTIVTVLIMAETSLSLFYVLAVLI
jgi:hypothetical protein